MKKLLIVLGASVILSACGSSEEKPAEEKKQDTVAETPAVQNERGLELIGASGCTTCHAIDKKVIGPAYIDVAAKYENTAAVEDTLVSKIKNGGQGNWGAVPMSPHPSIPEADIREMVKYILSLKK
jgi:cytochrome c